MATISGTIRGLQCMSRSFSGYGSREVWLLTADFGAYTGASDTAQITGVGAAINATARDGKTTTLLWGATAFPGADSNAQLVFPAGASVQAMTVSSDDLTGNLANTSGTELTSSTATVSPAGVLVGVTRS